MQVAYVHFFGEVLSDKAMCMNGPKSKQGSPKENAMFTYSTYHPMV